MNFLMKQIRRKKHLGEEERHYMPPRMEQGTFQHAMLVSQGNVVEAEEGPDSVKRVELEPQCEEVKEVVADKESWEKEKEEERVECLLSEESSPSVDGEVSDIREGCSADSDAEVELSIQTFSSEELRQKLTEATLSDVSLLTARTLAHKQQEGYHWADGLVFRTRLDKLGDNLEQLYLQDKNRTKCLTMAHDNGHSG